MKARHNFLLMLLSILCFCQNSAAYAADSPAETTDSQSGPAGKSAANNQAGNNGQQAPAQSVTLFGRIEQLVNQTGASLPRQLQKMTPILDLSKHGSADESQFSGAAVKSFPAEWEGIWKGLVTVSKRENMEITWLAQPAATYRSCQFFKPGSKLTLICRFHKEDGRLNLSPPVVSGRFKHAEDLVQAVLAGVAESSGSRINNYPAGKIRIGVSDFGQKTAAIARMETFSFGKRYGPSLGGNFVDSDVLSNQLRELAPGTMEQDVITTGTSHSLYGAPEAVSSLGESVVRLTRKGDKLIVELAYVSYQADGLCVNKCLLEGSLERVGD